MSVARQYEFDVISMTVLFAKINKVDKIETQLAKIRI